MSRRLLSFRGVTQEEIDGLREALEDAGIEFYEIPATAFGISAGSIWIRDNEDFPRAQEAFAAFQDSFAARARENEAPESLLSYIRRHPGQATGYTLIAIAILLVMLWPAFQLWA